MSADATASLSPTDLRRRLAAGDPVTLLDVRDRTEIERWRIEAPSITHHHVPYVKFVAAGVTGDELVLVVPRRQGATALRLAEACVEER